MKYRSSKDSATGLRKQIEVPNRIEPWWFQSAQGKVCISVKYCNCTIVQRQTQRGSGSAKELIEALTAIKTAVLAGELDAAIDSAASTLRSGFARSVR